MMQKKQDIAVRIGAAAALDQLAEESAELTHAALKLARIWRGVNPTPVSVADAVSALREEVSDVLLCVSVAEAAVGMRLPSETIEARKLARWIERLETAGGEAAGNDVDA